MIVDSRLTLRQDCVMPLGHIFREDKATQLSTRFLKAEGGSMDVIKLVKLVYLTDRLALTTCGRPVTFDTFYCMKHGPVVSSTMDCIDAVPEDGTAVYWSSFVSARDADHRVRLLRDPVADQLSPAEEQFANEVYRGFGEMGKWELRDYTHNLPEWKDPGDEKRTQLLYRDVLAADGWSEDDIGELVETLEAEVAAARILG